jgi:hypothetical protein
MLSFRMGKGDEEKQEVKKEKQKQKQKQKQVSGDNEVGRSATS